MMRLLFDKTYKITNIADLSTTPWVIFEKCWHGIDFQTGAADPSSVYSIDFLSNATRGAIID